MLPQARRRLRGCAWLCRMRHATLSTASALRGLAAVGRRSQHARWVFHHTRRAALLAWRRAVARRYTERQRTHAAGCHAWWGIMGRALSQWAAAALLVGSHSQRAVALERQSLHWRAPRLQARAWSVWAGTLAARCESIQYLRRALAHQQCRDVLRGWRCWEAHCARQASATERLIRAVAPPPRRQPHVGTDCLREAAEAATDSYAHYADEANLCFAVAERAYTEMVDPAAAPPPSFDRLLDRIVVLQQLVVDPAQPARGQELLAPTTGARVAAR